MNEKQVDLVIIGGGINGTGIAADASGRGLSVMLCEQEDLASATSSSSSKLIHGGLRYLEYYEFRLVREALREREILLRKAPHIIKPLRFVMPHNTSLRPAWLIRLGLFFYDHLGGQKLLPKSIGITMKQHAAGHILKDEFSKGFVYSDCWTDDARLVVLNAMQAKQQGAHILTRTRCLGAQRQANRWQVQLEDVNTGAIQIVYAQALVNAAGPWVNQLLVNLPVQVKRHVRLIKGSHIIVPKLYDEDFAFILQNPDKRIIFVIPYLNEYNLIGTTDVPYEGDPAHVKISEEEITYLCNNVNQYFKRQISKEDMVWNYAGVRPLDSDDAANPSAVTRDYTLEIQDANGKAPILNIFGGKITTYRKLAEHALDKLSAYFPNSKSAWTAKKALPGGDIADANFSSFLQQFQQCYAWLPTPLAYRYARNYGTLANQLLSNAKTLVDLGQLFGADLYAKEVDYLIANEWAKTTQDILWRRTKLGLKFTPTEIAALEQYLQEKL